MKSVPLHKYKVPLSVLIAAASIGFSVSRGNAQMSAGFMRPKGDAAAVERGGKLFADMGCAFCHGRDIRGGDGGPSLYRSTLVLTDKNGETIAPAIRAGKEGKMPAFDLSAEQITDIASFLHSFNAQGYAPTGKPRTTILVGNAEAGKAYFAKVCAGCHSVTGDLAGVGTRYGSDMRLQHKWLVPDANSGSRTAPTTIKITLADKTVISGKLKEMDEFTFVVELADGSQKLIERQGAKPQFVINYPLEAHTKLIRTYSDTDIHNVTAYLVTVK